jgi:hypothetical protein
MENDMSGILTSLHGRIVGMDNQQRVLALNGFIAGNEGSQRHEASPLVSADWDDFLGDTLDARWDAKTGSDGGVVTPTINVQRSGVVRSTTGAGATTTMAVNGVQLQGSLNWYAPAQFQGECTALECRIKLSAITNIAVFIGFTDQTAALEMPINGSGTADGFTTTATDAVGFVFDTAMTTKNWWGMGVANDVDSTGQNFGVAPVAATFETLRVELYSDNTTTGSYAKFYRNGVPIAAATPASNNSALMAGPRNSVGLTPVVAAFTRSAASATVDLDCLHIKQVR